MEKESQRFVIKHFWMKEWRTKRIRQKLGMTLGDDAYGVSQIKIDLHRFGMAIYPAKTFHTPGGRLPLAGHSSGRFSKRFLLPMP
jgi:hypothetical protein